MIAIESLGEYCLGVVGALFNLFMLLLSGIFGVVEIPRYLRSKSM